MSDDLDMLQGDCNLDDIVDIDLGSSGEVLPQKNDKIALVDADTVVFIGALNSQEECDILPREFYSDEEWKELKAIPSFDRDAGTYMQENITSGVAIANEKIKKILEKTGCKSAYLVFSGLNNFRYNIYPAYKANRDRTKTPAGIDAIREVLLSQYAGIVTDGYEADDLVVYLKKSNPDKYLLCAIDKDVINSIEGKHFNYYESGVHNIEMKFVDVDRYTALTWKFIQALTGDKTDNIIGLNRVGAATAQKFITDKYTYKELKDAIINAYISKGRTAEEAILNLNLVDMHLLHEVNNKLEVKLHEL